MDIQDDSVIAADAPATIEHRQPHGRHPEVRVRCVTGFNHEEGRFPGRLSDQCRQALRNGAESLASAGLSMQDVVSITYLLQNADAFSACFPLLRNAFGDARPGATLRLVYGFDVPDMQIELELVARRELVCA